MSSTRSPQSVPTVTSLRHIVVPAAVVLVMVMLQALLPAQAVGASPGASVPVPTLVRTDAGWVRGSLDDRGDEPVGNDVVRFSGIPYAAPPTGENRWTAPRPPRPWPGVRDAKSPGPVCAQPRFDPRIMDYAVVGEEDCLSVNVVAPARPRRHGRLPVLVWFHGGNFRTGAGSEYDGARMAARGDVIVVTVNYRLGSLGFLSTRDLDSEGTVSGGYGLLDQAEALRWVRRNAAAFGGNGRLVTVAGQSAGARAVCAHLAAPSSGGLFERAIVQSGACALPVMTKAEAERKGARAIADVGCADAADPKACLRRAPVEDLVLVNAREQLPVTAERRDDPWGPVAGTRYLPRQPIDTLRTGAAAGIPLLIGSTHDEMRPFVLNRHPDLTVGEYADKIRATFGADADAVLKRYPAERYPSPTLALAAVVTDWGGGIGSCPVLETARTASRHAPVYTYELLDGVEPYGAYHGWDLPFLWQTSIPLSQYPDYADMTPGQQRLSDAMIDYWTAFAHHGRPGSRGLPRWERTHPSSTTALGLAVEAIAPAPFASDHNCGFWQRHA